jgi:hypothetical protein
MINSAQKNLSRKPGLKNSLALLLFECQSTVNITTAIAFVKGRNVIFQRQAKSRSSKGNLLRGKAE